MAEVTYDNATCIYPGADRPAVDRLELAIEDGEFVVMVGPAERGGIRVGSALLQPPEAQLDAAKGHDKLIAGIRPEHLSIGEGELTVKVALVEDLGSDSYVYGHLADDPANSVIVRSGRQHPRPGEVVKVTADTDHLHLFDAASGLRIGD